MQHVQDAYADSSTNTLITLTGALLAYRRCQTVTESLQQPNLALPDPLRTGAYRFEIISAVLVQHGAYNF